MSPSNGAVAAELSPEPEAEAAPSAGTASRPSLDRLPHRAFLSLPVEIVVSVGTARPPLSELFAMDRDA